MILGICDNSSTLEAIRIVKIIITFISIIVPIILIVSLSITFTKGVTSSDGSTKKMTDSAIRKMVAAILIFLVPMIVGVSAKYTTEDFGYIYCLSKANPEGIQEAKVQEVGVLVSQAEKTYTQVDYEAALIAINNMEDSSERNAYIKRLSVIKDAVALKIEVESLLMNGTEDDYNRLVKKVNALPASQGRNEIVKLLKQMKERLDGEKKADASMATEGLNNGGNPSKQAVNNKNITLNYYKASTGQGFSYWLYVPENPDADLPTVIYIHGLGERGDDYHNNTTLGIAGGPIREVNRGAKSYNAILIQPQIPGDDKSQNYGRAIVELTTKIVQNLKGDMKKISISGFSNGCYGVFAIVSQFQSYFSSAVAMGCTPSNAGAFKTVPLWCLVGSGDGSSSMPSFVEQVKGLNGGQAYYTKVSHHSHNIVNDGGYSVFVDQKLVEWMISKRRN